MSHRFGRIAPGTTRALSVTAGAFAVATLIGLIVLRPTGEERGELPALGFMVLSEQSLTTVASGEVIATEIVRTLVGSIGLVAAVPVTTALAALVVGPGRAPSE